MYLFNSRFSARKRSYSPLRFLVEQPCGSRYFELNAEQVYVVRSDQLTIPSGLRRQFLGDDACRLLTKDRCRGESVPFSVMTGKIRWSGCWCCCGDGRRWFWRRGWCWWPSKAVLAAAAVVARGWCGGRCSPRKRKLAARRRADGDGLGIRESSGDGGEVVAAHG